jgi:hypothetical protein
MRHRIHLHDLAGLEDQCRSCRTHRSTGFVIEAQRSGAAAAGPAGGRPPLLYRCGGAVLSSGTACRCWGFRMDRDDQVVKYPG